MYYRGRNKYVFTLYALKIKGVDNSIYYVGKTMNLPARTNLHNSGKGTAPVCIYNRKLLQFGLSIEVVKLVENVDWNVVETLEKLYIKKYSTSNFGLLNVIDNPLRYGGDMHRLV